MNPRAELFIDKAAESLGGAESELAARRFSDCANRCYYSCLQAALAALADAGVRGADKDGQVSHAAVQARFSGLLIGRRKLYSSAIAGALTQLLTLRGLADYSERPISEIQARRATNHARTFVAEVHLRLKEHR